jgi:hypothetical protein
LARPSFKSYCEIRSLLLVAEQRRRQEQKLQK